MLKRRTLLKTLALTPLFKWESALSNKKELNYKYANSIDELRLTLPHEKGDLIELISHSSHTKKGGGIFIAINNEQNIPDDNGTVINTSSALSWRRLESLQKVKKPEWYGCQGDGSTDDSIPFSNMLHALQDGDCIILTEKSNYFNNLPSKESRWIIKNNDITIIGNDAVISRRGTLLNTRHIDGGNLATLKVVGVTNFKIEGELLITAYEIMAPLIDKKNNIVSKNNYPRAYVSSHGLFLEKVKKAYLPETLTCSNAVFPCYILECEDIKASGQFNNSGQVYPVSGADLQLGSGIKIAKTNDFIVNMTSNDCAYCGCEIEPYSRNGEVNVIAKNSYQHGCIIHRDGYNIKIKLLAENALGAGLKISAGSKHINGDITSSNCVYGCIVISEHSDICEDLDIRLHTQDIEKSDLVSKNVNDNFPSMRNAIISIIHSPTYSNSKSLKRTPVKTSSAILADIDNAQNCKIFLTTPEQNQEILLKNSSHCTITLATSRANQYKILENNNIGTSIEYK